MKYALVVGQQPTRPPPSLATTINSTKGGLMETRRSIPKGGHRRRIFARRRLVHTEAAERLRIQRLGQYSSGVSR
jgi:hypothetical protein